LHSFDCHYQIACQHDVRIDEGKKVGTGGIFHRFKEMADQRSSEIGPVDGWNLTKAELFTNLPNPRLVTENNHIAKRAEGPTAKGVTLEVGNLPYEGLTGSEKG
jgi:hypothetical protein